MLNSIAIQGRLVHTPEAKVTKSGKDVCTFSIACDRQSGGQKETDFFNCTAFGKTAEMIEKNFHKGRKIAISGEWRTGSYTNKDGNKVYTNDCFVNSVYFVDSKNSSNQQAGSENPAPQNNGDGFMNIPDGIDEELPFN